VEKTQHQNLSSPIKFILFKCKKKTKTKSPSERRALRFVLKDSGSSPECHIG